MGSPAEEAIGAAVPMPLTGRRWEGLWGCVGFSGGHRALLRHRSVDDALKPENAAKAIKNFTNLYGDHVSPRKAHAARHNPRRRPTRRKACDPPSERITIRTLGR